MPKTTVYLGAPLQPDFYQNGRKVLACAYAELYSAAHLKPEYLKSLELIDNLMDNTEVIPGGLKMVVEAEVGQALEVVGKVLDDALNLAGQATIRNPPGAARDKFAADGRELRHLRDTLSLTAPLPRVEDMEAVDLLPLAVDRAREGLADLLASSDGSPVTPEVEYFVDETLDGKKVPSVRLRYTPELAVVFGCLDGKLDARIHRGADTVLLNGIPSLDMLGMVLDPVKRELETQGYTTDTIEI